jgi:hypothetical protein
MKRLGWVIPASMVVGLLVGCAESGSGPKKPTEKPSAPSQAAPTDQPSEGAEKQKVTPPGSEKPPSAAQIGRAHV